MVASNTAEDDPNDLENNKSKSTSNGMGMGNGNGKNNGKGKDTYKGTGKGSGRSTMNTKSCSNNGRPQPPVAGDPDYRVGSSLVETNGDSSSDDERRHPGRQNGRRISDPDDDDAGAKSTKEGFEESKGKDDDISGKLYRILYLYISKGVGHYRLNMNTSTY